MRRQHANKLTFADSDVCCWDENDDDLTILLWLLVGGSGGGTGNFKKLKDTIICRVEVEHT